MTESVNTTEFRELAESVGTENAKLLVALKFIYTDDDRLAAAKFIAPLGVTVTGKH